MTEGRQRSTDTRLAELLAALSLATDIGRGFPFEKALRDTLIAVRIAEALGLVEADRSAVYFAALLRPAGCTAFSYEAARTFGTNEVTSLPGFLRADGRSPREIMTAILGSAHGLSPPARARVVAKNLVAGKAFADYATRADCEAASRFAGRFALPDAVPRIAGQGAERWDGKGGPARLSGEAIEVGARVLALAEQVEIFHRSDGRGEARAMARRRSGGWFDPACVDAFSRCADAIFEEIESGSAWEAVLAAEPYPPILLRESRLDDVALAFADFVDLKSPYLLGHSRGVAALAEAAAAALGFAAADGVALRRAGLLHDLGRVAVSNVIWDKRSALSPAEWEAVRLHAYQTERVLSRSSVLAPLGVLAGLHHERLNGDGYHRGVSAASLPRAARVLAAADVYRALVEDRPHRPAFAPEQAAKEIEAMASAGALDHEAVAAVCEAAGVSIGRRPPAWPAGLTDREVDVLRLLARGLSKKQIAKALFIAPGTVHTHTVHIYEKLGVSTRAGVALFAMEHGLVEA